MKLLIYSPDAYSVFHTETRYVFGGIEIETGHHAIGLSELGVEVHVLTKDHGTPAHRHGKIYLHPITELKGRGYWDKRNTLMGRIRYRLSGDTNRKTIEQCCNEIQADCYYAMGISLEALRILRFAKKNNRKFIFRAAHDLDLGDADFSEQRFLDWAGMKTQEVNELIENADQLIAQTPLQQKLFRERFGKESQQMFPPIVIETQVTVSKEFDALWIGRTNSFKRPEELLKLAVAHPDKKFCMVLNRMSESEWSEIDRTKTENITLIESVPADRIEEYFRKSRLYISTSLQEGFPNTFLQAAKNGVPVLAMGSDPNNMLTVHGAGEFVGDNSHKLAESFGKLLRDKEVYEKASRAGRAYVEKFNDRRIISEQLYQLIQSVLSRK